jgi:hypothetical protein
MCSGKCAIPRFSLCRLLGRDRRDHKAPLAEQHITGRPGLVLNLRGDENGVSQGPTKESVDQHGSCSVAVQTVHMDLICFPPDHFPI